MLDFIEHPALQGCSWYRLDAVRGGGSRGLAGVFFEP